MKVIITRNTFVKGELVEASDKPIDLDEQAARQLIKIRKAAVYDEAEAAAEEPAAEEPAAEEPKAPAGKGGKVK